MKDVYLLSTSKSNKPFVSLLSNYDSFGGTVTTHSFLSKTFIQAVKTSIISDAETAPGGCRRKKKEENDVRWRCCCTDARAVAFIIIIDLQYKRGWGLSSFEQQEYASGSLPISLYKVSLKDGESQLFHWQHYVDMSKVNQSLLHWTLTTCKKWLFTLQLMSEPLRTQSSMSKKEREMLCKKTEREREREGEREGEMCYITLGSANLLIMLLMFLSEDFYGCFVYKGSAE